MHLAREPDCRNAISTPRNRFGGVPEAIAGDVPPFLGGLLGKTCGWLPDRVFSPLEGHGLSGRIEGDDANARSAEVNADHACHGVSALNVVPTLRDDDLDALLGYLATEVIGHGVIRDQVVDLREGDCVHVAPLAPFREIGA